MVSRFKTDQSLKIYALDKISQNLNTRFTHSYGFTYMLKMKVFLASADKFGEIMISVKNDSTFCAYFCATNLD